jgi:hypothetical protein
MIRPASHRIQLERLQAPARRRRLEACAAMSLERAGMGAPLTRQDERASKAPRDRAARCIAGRPTVTDSAGLACPPRGFPWLLCRYMATYKLQLSPDHGRFVPITGISSRGDAKTATDRRIPRPGLGPVRRHAAAAARLHYALRVLGRRDGRWV